MNQPYSAHTWTKAAQLVIRQTPFTLALLRERIVIMLKKFLVMITLLIAFFSLATAQDHPGFHVKGRHLYDKCGEKVILRGVNKMIIWKDIDGIPAYAEIAQTGANVVRIVWNDSGPALDLDKTITNCIAQQMIPMVESHDATGKWELLDKAVDYWIRPDIVPILQKHEQYLLLNIANECGDAGVTTEMIRTKYCEVIQKMRLAGIHVPLIIDATDWGKNINILQSEGPALLEADPDHNLIFSIHLWWPVMWGYSEKRIIEELAESVAMELPLIVGEFGNRWDETPGGVIPWRAILKQCQLYEIGWLAWSWGPGNKPQTFLDMTRDGSFATLHDWGLAVAITDSFSIKNTSVRPAFILNLNCEQAPGKNK